MDQARAVNGNSGLMGVGGIAFMAVKTELGKIEMVALHQAVTADFGHNGSGGHRSAAGIPLDNGLLLQPGSYRSPFEK